MGCFHRAKPVGAGGAIAHVRQNMLNEVLIPPKLMEPEKKSGTLKLKDLVDISNLMESFFLVYSRQL